ncbi:MAG TPA: ABC transporter permease [Syntrophorhabdaceae bacterium]|nr:ABC transporter permease [Syntrophorhabdaceae bacterium]
MSETPSYRGVWPTIKRLPLLPALLLMPILLFGTLGPLFYSHDPVAMNPAHSMQPPYLFGGQASYFLGTDHLGRDVYSKIVEGARASLVVAVTGVLLAGVLGIFLGMVAGYFGGWIDEVIMRIVDIQMSIPAILLTILISAALGGGLITITICVALVFWTQYARIIRGETLSIKEREFVLLARMAGCGTGRMFVRHIMPNLVSTSTVVATLQLGRAIIIEASITFLGLGIQPPKTAWGLMMAEGRMYLSTAWWLPAFAGFAIVITVLGANMMGDWIRDRLDPKLKQL